MGCDNCEIKAIVDGKEVHVRLLLNNLEKLFFDDEQMATFYYCSKCQAYWKLGGYAKAAEEVSETYVAKEKIKRSQGKRGI